PALAFDRAVAADALRYGAQVAGGELLYYVYTNADYLVIGAAWGKAAVGAYRLAYELVLDVVRLVSLGPAPVAFPAVPPAGGPARRAADPVQGADRDRAGPGGGVPRRRGRRPARGAVSAARAGGDHRGADPVRGRRAARAQLRPAGDAGRPRPRRRHAGLPCA